MKPKIEPGDEVFTRITPYQVLSECIDKYQGDKRSFSRDGAFQVPQPGYELAFKAVDQKIAILQDLMHKAHYGTAKEG